MQVTAQEAALLFKKLMFTAMCLNFTDIDMPPVTNIANDFWPTLILIQTLLDVCNIPELYDSTLQRTKQFAFSLSTV